MKERLQFDAIFDDVYTIVDYLVFLRKKNGYSQKEFAKKIDMDVTQLCKIERHQHQPSVWFVLCCCSALSVKIQFVEYE